MCVCVCVSVSVFSPWVISNSLWLNALKPIRSLHPWNFPGRNTGVSCHFTFPGDFPTQGLNLHLLHLLCWQMDSLQLAPPVNPNTNQPFYIWKMLPKRNENMLTQRPVLKYSTQVYLRAKPRNNPNIQQLVFRLKKTNSYTKFKIGKGVQQGSILSPCLFNLCTEYIMRNARLDEAQAGIKIARRNINSDMQMASPFWQKLKRN